MPISALSGWFDRAHTYQQYSSKRGEKMSLKPHTLVNDSDFAAPTETLMEIERLWMTI
ncbi:MAG: hypothetical protein ACAF41_26765 [Leptolyngbya sp. BL-A-14]